MTEAETAALLYLQQNGGSVLISRVPDVAEKGLFGEVFPGIRTYKKLEVQGFLYITEEDVEDDGFQFTPSIELTEKGMTVVKELSRQQN